MNISNQKNIGNSITDFIADKPRSSDTSTVVSSNDSVHSTRTKNKIPKKKGKKATKSSFWKKTTDKPKRPLSAYNIFFKHTRNRIINGLGDNKATHEEITKAAAEAIAANSTQPRIPRSNRKTHGKIAFGDLARQIGGQWKELDSDQKKIYEHYASIDMKRYRNELSIWKERKERASSPTSSLESSTSSYQHTVQGSESFANTIDNLPMNVPNVVSSDVHFAESVGNSAATIPDDDDIQARSKRISMLKVKLTQLKLEQELKNEICIRRKQLSATDRLIESSEPPLFSFGPSIERMRQFDLKRRRMDDNSRSSSCNNHKDKDIASIDNTIKQEEMEIDPVPFGDIFNPSDLDFLMI